MDNIGKFEIECTDRHIYNIGTKLMSEPIEIVYQICPFYCPCNSGQGNVSILYESASKRAVYKRSLCRA